MNDIPAKHTQDVPFLRDLLTNYNDKWLSLNDQSIEDRKFFKQLIDFFSDIDTIAHELNNGTIVVRYKGSLHFIPKDVEKKGFFYFYNPKDVEGPLHVVYRTTAIIEGVQYSDIPVAGTKILNHPVGVLYDMMPKAPRRSEQKQK